MVKRIVTGALQGDQKALLTLVEILRTTGGFEPTDVEGLLPDNYETILDAYVEDASARRRHEGLDPIRTRRRPIMRTRSELRSTWRRRDGLVVFLQQASRRSTRARSFMHNWHIDAIVHAWRGHRGSSRG